MRGMVLPCVMAALLAIGGMRESVGAEFAEAESSKGAALSGASVSVNPPGEGVEAVIEGISFIMDIVGLSLDISDELGDESGQQTDEILANIQTVNTTLYSMNTSLTQISSQLTSLEQQLNISTAMIMNQQQQNLLSPITAEINATYSQFTTTYAAFGKKSQADQLTDLAQGTTLQAVRHICATLNYQTMLDNQQQFSNIITGANGGLSALDALTSLLKAQMTVSDANARATPTLAYQALRQYFANYLILQGQGLYTIKEYILSQSGMTSDQRRQQYSTYYQGTYLEQFIKPQVAKFLSCAAQIVMCDADLTSVTNRGVSKLLPDTTNPVGVVILSDAIAAQIHSDAQFVAGVAYPDYYGFGLKFRLVCEPWLFPHGTSPSLTITPPGGSPAACPPPTLSPVAVPAYLQWMGTDTDRSTQLFSSASTVYACDWSMATDTAVGDYGYTLERVETTGARTALGSGTVSVGGYDKNSGQPISDPPPSGADPVQYGFGMLAIDRNQPSITFSNMACKTLSYTGNAPQSWNSIYLIPPTNKVYSDGECDFVFFGHGTGAFTYSGTYDVSINSYDFKNSGQPCVLGVTHICGSNVFSYNSGLMSTSASVKVYLQGGDGSTTTPVVSPTQQFNGGNYIDYDLTAPMSKPMMANATVRIVDVCENALSLSNFWSSVAYVAIVFGPVSNFPAQIDYVPRHWSYGTTFTVAQPVGNDLTGAGKSNIVAKAPSATTGFAATGSHTHYVISIDKNLKPTLKAAVESVPDDAGKPFLAFGDMDGDRLQEMLFQSQTDGCLYAVGIEPDTQRANVWRASASGIANSAFEPGESFAALANLAGNGATDVITSDATTGALSARKIHHKAVRSKEPLLDAEGNPMSGLAAVGDFDGDGIDDLITTTQDGAFMIHLMKGATASSSTVLGQTPKDKNWKIWETGDFDGDGKKDLLWVNTSTEAVVISLMNGSGVKRMGSPKLPGRLNEKGWRLVNAKDFNGDGKTDLLWSKDKGTELKLTVVFMNGVDVAKSKIGRSGLVGKLNLPSGTEILH